MDSNPIGPESAYRIKLRDADGTAFYSKVIRMNTNLHQETNLSIHPNPTSGKFEIAFRSIGDIAVAVFNSAGQPIHQQSVQSFGNTKLGIATK